MAPVKDKKYKVIDIFAGPGGLGEGFSAFTAPKAKHPFEIAISIEKDLIAHSTLLLRSFFRKFTDSPPKEYWQYIKGEITRKQLFDRYPEQSNAAYKEALHLELSKTTHSIVKQNISKRLQGSNRWVLVGGPPCQAYSLVGRARMMSTREDFEEDERHFLYREYLRILADHKPPVFVMENVKGLLSARHNGQKIIGRILEDLKKPGKALKGSDTGLEYRLYSLVERNAPDTDYAPEDFLVRAENYGIPQARHRILLLGIRKDINVTPEVLGKAVAPSVADVIGDLPRIRSYVSREQDSYEIWKNIVSDAANERWYQKGKTNGLLDTVKVIDVALKKLETDKLTAGGESLSYRKKPKEYAEWFRSNCDGIISNHAARGHMRTDLHRYLFASAFASANDRSAGLRDFPRDLLPDHRNVDKALENNHFSDRFRVQLSNSPSTTITSHISKDGHYFIHYDPSQCRSLTVREAARLQTFPDNYKFEGNRTSQYHQVGNAVPPLLAIQVAEVVHDILNSMKD